MYLTELDLKVAKGELQRPKIWDPVIETLVERGAAHAQAFIDHLSDRWSISETRKDWRLRHASAGTEAASSSLMDWHERTNSFGQLDAVQEKRRLNHAAEVGAETVSRRVI